MQYYVSKNYRYKDSSIHDNLKTLAASEKLSIPEMIEKLMNYYTHVRKIEEIQKSKKGADKVDKGD